jgi:hypothetical protein
MSRLITDTDTVKVNVLQRHATRSVLAGVTSPAAGWTRYVSEAGYEGLFTFDASNLSSQVTADSGQVIYVAPTADTTGTSGAWVRTNQLIRGATTVPIYIGYAQVGNWQSDGLHVTGVGAFSGVVSGSNIATGSALISDTDGTLAANSDTKVATQKATKTYVDNAVTGLGTGDSPQFTGVNIGHASDTTVTRVSAGVIAVEGATIATRTYVDDKVAGLSWKQAVRAATTANGTLATAFANGQTIDGVTLATGDRILLKNQSSASENGIYIVAASGAPTRATDADSAAELVNASVYVSEGSTLADTQWTCTTNATITVNTTALAFAQLTSGGSSITVKDEGSTLTSALTSMDFVGSGVVATNTGGAVTVTVSAGSGNKWLLQWSPIDNEPPSSNYATLDTRNGHPTLDFDTTTQEAAIFSGVLPSDYAGAGITVTVYCAATSATSGTVGWLASIERMDASTLDIDADSFASAQTITATTVPGTSGQLLKLSVNISSGANMDSLAAGEMFRLKIERDVANDTATGDAELLRVTMKEQ